MPTLIAPIKVDNYQRWDGGIAPYDKDAANNQYAFGRSVNYRKNPHELSILPKTVKESGSVYLDLPVDGDRVDNDTYIYDQSGNIYKRTIAGSHTLLRSVANSQGNGMHYYGEDDFLYYLSNTTLGRYGQMHTAGSPTFVDDFLGAEGGVPLNTNSLDLEASSSQYASHADATALSITGNLAIEATITPESLPAIGNSMVLASKWDVNGNLRSYKFEIYAISGYFGDGSDGSLVISANTTEAPIDSACTGTSGAYTLTATNASFASGQVIKIYQSQGTGAGTFQKNRIVSYTAGTITLESALNASYTTGAQVRVLKQYTNVTINAGFTYLAKAWNGTVGGILAFLANGTLTGTTAAFLSATGCGFRGGARGEIYGQNSTGQQGEGITGTGVQSTSRNGIGGGGGARPFYNNDSGNPGADGGYGTAGANGTSQNGQTVAQGGTTAGTTDLTTLLFGGGGGGGGFGDASASSSYGTGGRGGGIIDIAVVTLACVAGGIVSNGAAGLPQFGDQAVGGHGAGGSVLIAAQTATVGALGILATGGGDGRTVLNYLTSYTGTANPTLNAIQDNTLVTTATYQLRLALSNNGTAEEFLTKNSTIAAGQSSHVGVSWNASGHVAEFFQNGESLGSSTGAFTAIQDNTSRFAVGADFNNTARNFYDGLIDEVRIWNTTRTAAQMYANKSTQISVSTAGLVGYYQFNNNYDDSTSNANNLTSSGSPVFSSIVAFASPTTRLDIDQTLATSGNTYTLATAISETAANRQSFVPAKDPQKSIGVMIAAKGTGDWTLTVHDAVNRTVASVTVTNANLPTAGAYEFMFSSVWRPVRGATYHFHLTSTVADGTVTTTTAADMETAAFTSYYQFLVSDQYHPSIDMLNFMSFGNERYLATYDAASYDPHRLVLPAGWRIRCLEKYRGFLAIGCWRGSDVGSFDEGMIFFWDGYSPTYNDNVPVPEGAVNAMKAERGKLHVFAGYQGDIVDYVGGDSSKKFRRLPKTSIDTSLEILPKAVTMWQGLLRLGVGTSDSAVVERGVYTIGQLDDEQSLSISYDYPISSGNRLSTVQVGFLLAVNKKLLIGCKDGTSSWVDVVDAAGSPFATATVEKDIKDYGAMWKQKDALTVRADFKPLNTGETVKVKYKLDRQSDWVEGETDAKHGLANAAGDTIAKLTIPKGNHREIQFAADLGTSVSTSPVLLELLLEENLKPSEQIV